MAFSQTVDHTLLDPKGRVGGCTRFSTADKIDRQRAKSRSFVATTRLRAKLHNVKVVQGDDSSWLHVVGDKVVARFASVTDAVAAL
jgi:hypothetical protein